MKRKIVAVCAATAAVLAASAVSIAASSGDHGWTAYTPDHDGRGMVVVAGQPGERHAAMTEAEAEAQGWTGYESAAPAATSAACVMFRAADDPADAVDLANMAEPIADNAI